MQKESVENGTYAGAGDMSMYTKEALIRRNRVKKNKKIKRSVAEFWKLLADDLRPMP